MTLAAALRRLFARPSPAHPVAPSPAPLVVTAEMAKVLRAIGWNHVEAYAAALAVACSRNGIDTPDRLAAFLAQVGHESGGGVYTREIWGPTPAQLRYEGRADLGNTEPGDGARFRGRGLIQITGRANTVRAHQALQPDWPLGVFLTWLESIEGAAVSAAWWWNDHGCNGWVDRGDFEGLTRRINGGMNGYGDRVKRLRAALDALHTIGMGGDRWVV